MSNKYSDEELEERIKLIIKELKRFPDSSTLENIDYWGELLEQINSRFGSIENFYQTRIGNNFLISNTVSFPSPEQDETTTQMIEKPRLLIRDRAGVGKTAPVVKAKFALEQLIHSGSSVNAIVACPNFVLSSWQSKLEQYLERKPRVLTITSSNRAESIREFESGIREGNIDFTLVSYDALFRIIDRVDRDSADYLESDTEFNDDITLADRLTFSLGKSSRPFMFVPDECQYAKNPGAYRSQAVRKLALAADYFYPLSGDIFQDNLEDIGEIASLLEPDTYPTAQHFNREYGKNPKLIRLFLKRFSKDPVLDICDLPGNPNIFHHDPTRYNLTDIERRAYEAVQNHREFHPGSKLSLLRLAAIDSRLLLPDYHRGSRLENQLREFLRQNEEIENHLSNYDFDPTSYQELDRIVEGVVNRGEKIIIWSKFREGITKELETRYSRFGSCRIDGTVNSDPRNGVFSDRDKSRLIVQTNPDVQILIATIDSLREGQDVYAANNDTFLLEDFSPGPNNQAIGRTYRRGQKRDVNVNRMYANATINAGVRRTVIAKSEGIEQVEKAIELDSEKKEVLDKSKPATNKPDVRKYMMNSHSLIRFLSGFMIGHGSESNLEFLEQGENAQLYAQAYNFLWNTSFSAHTSRLISGLVADIEEKEERLESIIDAGSGPATVSRTLLRNSLCVDLNPYQLEIGKRECEKLGLNIETIVGDAENLEFVNDGVNDLSVLSLVLHYGNCDDGGRKRMILEANRVIRNGGYSIITLPESIIQSDGKMLLEDGLYELGLEPLEDKTGIVEAVDSSDKDYKIYVVVCKKIYNNPGSLYNDDKFNNNFVLNPEFYYVEFKGKNVGPTQNNGGIQEYKKEVYRIFKFQDSGRVIGSRVEPPPEVKPSTDIRKKSPGEIADLFKKHMRK